MRIDTLGLLCESNRSTEIISTEEMQWIQFFITYNLNSQSPGVRQQICSLLKKVKFLFRKCRKVVNFARAQIWGECGLQCPPDAGRVVGSSGMSTAPLTALSGVWLAQGLQPPLSPAPHPCQAQPLWLPTAQVPPPAVSGST